jgi:chromosomal replication initiator protein
MSSALWRQMLPLISQSIDHHRFETWFRPLEPLESVDTATLTLATPNQFISDFLDQHYKDIILSLAQRIEPAVRDVHFTVAEVFASPANTPEKKIALPTPPQRPARKHSFNPQYTFDLFVVGPGNEFAKSVSFAVAEAPGKTKFNPLLIYGGVGLGKTHLLHAIGLYVCTNFPDAAVTYATSEEFYYNFIESIKNNNTKTFSDLYRKSDILLVDDVQFLAGKESTQEEFFYIFNTLYQHGKQIVLTSDLPPTSIKGLQDRLVSRFQWGLCVDIQPPNLETRVAIVKKKAEKDNLSLPDDVLYYIAEHVSSNIREIEGVIIKLLALASITNTDISVDLVKSILKGSVRQERPRIAIDDIIEQVALYFKVPVNNIREKNRRKEVAHCRQVAMYIAKSVTNHSLKSIGLHFGGRDHSTVIHAVQQIDRLQIKDESVKRDINYIISELSK